MNVLMLCRERDLQGERWGYARAFARCGVNPICVGEGILFDEDIRDLVAACGQQPALILQPESGFPLLPQGLTQTGIPTACFHFDTFSYTCRRIRWSMLFDYAVLVHPG